MGNIIRRLVSACDVKREHKFDLRGVPSVPTAAQVASARCHSGLVRWGGREAIDVGPRLCPRSKRVTCGRLGGPAGVRSMR